MKMWTVQSCCLALVLALFPMLGGCDQEEAHSAPVTDISTNPPPPDSATTDTNQPAPDAMSQQLANAPGTIISTPDTAAANTNNNPQLNDVVKLVQAGVGESVLMAYVTNFPGAFNVSSDDILYLNDLGLAETVITAMIQRDQHFNGTAAPSATQTQPAYANPAPPAPAPDVDQNVMAQAPDNTPPPEVVDDAEQAPNGSYSYFYDSLSPYGSWVNIEGYGPCWQPTAVIVNPGWQPYCDRGHWAYTDCGWYWVSDYSWGWAPFHYGRWFRNSRFGWCWAPDTVWSPAWVSWRYSSAYCGWAALPPTACYRPGFGFTYLGRSVGFNFGFGLGAGSFVFVSLDHFHDRSPSRFRLPHQEITKVFNTTVVNTQLIRGNNNNLINRGVPVDRIAAATHAQILPIRVHADAEAPGSPQLGRDGRSLSVYRPALPMPRPTGNPRLAGEGVQPDAQFDLRSRIERTPEVKSGNPQRPFVNPVNPANPMTPARRPIIVNPSANTPRDQGLQENPGRPNRFSQPNGDNPGQDAPPNLRPGPVFQPQMPAQPAAPPQDNRRIFAPSIREPLRPDSQQQNLGTPSFDRSGNGNGFRRNGGDSQWQQRDLQQPTLPMPRQEAPIPRGYDAPREQPRVNNPDFNSGNRSEPVAPRTFEPRSEPPAHAPAPQNNAPQSSAPSHQDNSQNGGNGNWGGSGNGGGRGNH